VVRPGSRCPVCAVPIAARDNIPVVSWVLLRGRARCCGARVDLRYPGVELATALSLVGVAAWTGPSWRLPAFAYLAALSIALAVIDVDTQRLPFWLVAPSYPVAAALLGIACWSERDGAAAVRSVAGAALLWGFYRLLHLVYPAGMGYGDVRLAGLLGLYLSWLGWDELVVGAFFAFLVGGLGGAAQIALRKVSLKSSIPFGPYMLVGAWLGILLGQPVAGWYLHTAGLA
jgi:leader peptidase (prepilin peptidase)/N-methyltransferase